MSLRSGLIETVECPAGSLFVADLHLEPTDPVDAQRLVRFAERAHGAPVVAILGDLFESWVGPAHARLPGAHAALDALSALARSGTAVHFVPGNRDFLLADDIERACGARAHPHGFVALAGSLSVLAVHGDELCTLDHAYQRMKRALRSRPVAWLAPRLPAPVALAAARKLRRTSVRAVAAKPAASKAQQASEAERLAAAHGCQALLCGHAHTFRDERTGRVRWIVLDAFGGERDCVAIGPDGALGARSSRAA